MFTGLVEGMGSIKGITRAGGDMGLIIMPLFEMSDCRRGDSICVSGVCLTVTHIKDKTISMDVSGETMARSTMGQLRKGDEVNLERSLRLSDRLGGHLVSGHVDGVGIILKKESIQRSWLVGVEIDQKLSRYTIEKGSIAVDGISLTINRCQEGYFEVNIIPETARQTTILKNKVGDRVNIETDLIAKYVERFFLKGRLPEKGKASSRIDGEMLKRFGFGD